MWSLTLALRAVAILMLITIVFAYVNSGELQLKQFIAANVLFVLSLFTENQQKRLAIVSLALAVIISIGTVRAHVVEQESLMVVLVNLIGLIYLAVAAVLALKSS